MADVSDLFLSRLPPNVVDERRNVILAHFNEAELPELTAFVVRVQVLVLTTVLRASLVADPDIVTCLRQLESRSNIVSIDYPAVSTRQEPMLHEYDGLLWQEYLLPDVVVVLGPLDVVIVELRSAPGLDSEHLVEVAVWCLYFVALQGEPVLLHYLLESLEVIRQIWQIQGLSVVLCLV